MKRFSEQLHKQASTVKLQAAEKRELRERLVAYMEYHPLPAEMKAKKATPAVVAPVVSETFTMIKVPFHTLFKYSAAAAVVVLVLFPFVAERAIPGDALYAIKVQFNEEVRSTLTFDGYQKVEWETERLNRRIAEARLLASEGRLTEEVEAEVAEAVRTHTENAKREIEVLRTEDADGAAIASIALDTTLEVQSTSLKGEDEALLAEGQEELRLQPVNLIADAIDASRVPVAEQAASSTPPGYDKLMARIEQNTTRIYELLTSLQGIAPAEELADVQRRIEDVERSMQVAIKLGESDDVQARTALVGILQRTQRLIVYMTELEVTETVDIETLVPVELTEAEEEHEMSRLNTEITEKTTQIENMLATVVDEEVIEKAAFAQVAIAELEAKMASSTEDFSAFRAFAKEAITLADDSIVLLERFVIPVEVDMPEETEEGTGTSTATSSTASTSTSTATSTEINSDLEETVGTSTPEGEEVSGEVVVEEEDRTSPRSIDRR